MKRRVCLVVASEMTVRAFLRPHLRAMQAHYDITIVVNTANGGLLRELEIEGTLVPVRIERRVSPWRDLVAFVALHRLLRAGRFAVVHSMTPKAGLIAMGAAWLARIPVRIHTFTGQVWATRRGFARTILWASDAAVARLATMTTADSRSQREFLIREGVAPESKLVVLADGSVSGVDAARFRPDATVRRDVRARLNIEAGDVLLLFVGRLTKDKGVLDLAEAFRTLAGDRPDVQLLFVGPDESRLRQAIVATCAPHARRVQFLDFTDRPQDLMAAADILCLPSYREGFGSVIIEAAACALPSVASRVYGLVDAVENGETGLLHEPGDVAGLASELYRLVADTSLRRALGEAARRRVERNFPVSRLTDAQLSFYSELLEDASRPEPAVLTAAAPAPPFLAQVGRGATGDWYRRFGKRILDLVVVSFALVVLSPLFATLAALIRARLGPPILFRQKRPGLDGKPFVLVKFRSMTDRYDDRGNSLPDGERLTRLGRFLRASSLDELPELWNVLVGDMSLVGPRPLLMEYLPRYTARQAARHAVRPGITGLAQVSGRNSLPWEERFELDLWYADHLSLPLDLRILLRTVWHVIARRGISQPGHATSREFSGVEQR